MKLYFYYLVLRNFLASIDWMRVMDEVGIICQFVRMIIDSL